jgi:TrmH family RNA methyltransferase
MLTSVKNPRIQHIRKLQSSPRTRHSEKRFVVEGVRLVEEVFKAGLKPQAVFFTEDVNQRGLKAIDGFGKRGVDCIPIAPHVMQAASDTQTPQGILALMPFLQLPVPTNPDFMVVLDGIRDPGNLGTILRTALAAGVEAVLLPPGTVDPFAPKVVRAAMGAHFSLPIQSLSWSQISEISTSLGLKLYLADASAGQIYFNADFRSSLGLIIGGEAAGAGEEARNLASSRVHIPMPGGADSLNAAVAAAVLLFEVQRQRS